MEEAGVYEEVDDVTVWQDHPNCLLIVYSQWWRWTMQEETMGWGWWKFCHFCPGTDQFFICFVNSKWGENRDRVTKEDNDLEGVWRSDDGISSLVVGCVGNGTSRS